MNKKSLLLVLTGYVIWGLLPLYWAMLSTFDALFILATRMVWSAILTFLLLVILKKLPALKALIADKQKMKFLVPAAFVITINWGVYIWSVSSGFVMDASLGYYMNPLAVFLCGIFVFKEKCGKLELFALVLAFLGVAFSTFQYGKFPFIALTLAISFAVYGILKKFAHADALCAICTETLLVTPFALLFLLFSPVSAQAFASMTTPLLLLCICTGVATALPMTLYSQGVNHLPFVTMGFLQYISPTLMLFIGLFQGEPFSLEQGICFGFIWAGLTLFTIGMVRRHKAENAAQRTDEQPV